MLSLPPEVRRPQDQREDHPAREPRCEEEPSLRRQEETDQQPDHQEADRPFVLQPDADREADREPEPDIPRPEQPDQEEGDDRPHQEIRRRRAQQMTGQEQTGRRRCAHARSDLARSPGPELPRRKGGEDDQGAVDQRRDQAERDQGAGRDGLGEPRDRGRDRRLIDEPPGQPPAAREEIELVSMVSVASGHEQQRHDACRCDDRHGAERKGLQLDVVLGVHEGMLGRT